MKTLANIFETEPEKLVPSKEIVKLDRAKLINLSSLIGLLIPFGGVLFPLILTYKTKDSKNKELGKSIVSVQIILSFALAILLILSPFLQKAFSIQYPLFLVPLIGSLCLKMIVVLVNGISLNQKQELAIKLKNNFL